MSVRCRDVITPPPPIETQSISASSSSGDGLSSRGATKGATMSSPLTMEERSKAARKRATEAVKQNAKKFMDLAKMTSQMYDDYDDGEDDDKEKVEVDGRMQEEVKGDDGVPSTLSRTGSSSAGPASPECIICREETGQPLGYVGFGRRSRVLDVRMEQEKPRPGVHLQVGTGMDCGRGSDLLACFDLIGRDLVRFGSVRFVLSRMVSIATGVSIVFEKDLYLWRSKDVFVFGKIERSVSLLPKKNATQIWKRQIARRIGGVDFRTQEPRVP